jgi:glycosyltransferase involved in cell wall biosynthesis
VVEREILNFVRQNLMIANQHALDLGKDRFMYPLVSCIMPTHNRQRFMPQAIRYFLEQDYPYKELIIVDDNPVQSTVDIPDGREIRYYYLPGGRRPLGEKRNYAISQSNGDIVMHWDDDDWMARGRIRRQVEFLLSSGADICGLDKMLFYDVRSHTMWLYTYPPSRKKWLAGGSFCYWKSVWEQKKFQNISQGEDTQFVWSSLELKILPLQDFHFYVALIHPGNTSVKSLSGCCWGHWNEKSFQDMVGEDWGFYQGLNF